MYKSILSLRETEDAIDRIKRYFQYELSNGLNLYRVSAPLFIEPETGLNDGLNGWESAVSFKAKDIDHPLEIVHSLAKWKRYSLYRYGFTIGEGIHTDMNAIRKDETLDRTHSIYVDQYDWERIISSEMRNTIFLKEIVDIIYSVIRDTENHIHSIYSSLGESTLSPTITYVSTQDALDTYPTLTPKERENALCEKYGSIFLMNIGGKLDNDTIHDGRASDYDDWTLNGDILVWSPILNEALELSSMGIRVDKDSLLKQLDLSGELHKVNSLYHRLVLDNTLPLTIGGGIGQSRLAMFLLKKHHIGECHSSIWNITDEISLL